MSASVFDVALDLLIVGGFYSEVCLCRDPAQVDFAYLVPLFLALQDPRGKIPGAISSRFLRNLLPLMLTFCINAKRAWGDQE